jgi:hypothetical protein
MGWGVGPSASPQPTAGPASLGRQTQKVPEPLRGH